jgi:hypothetical protein
MRTSNGLEVPLYPANQNNADFRQHVAPIGGCVNVTHVLALGFLGG